MSQAVSMQGVRKTFGPKVAVEGIDLSIPEGAIYGFIGPNGAGKTTTIRMIMSILFPDRGELSVLGKESAVESKDRIGYLPEERGVYRKMKERVFLEHMGKLKGMRGGSALRSSINEWLERVELADVANKKCEELSKGMQQKIQFISCVLHKPDLLILDEPFSGLDPVNMRLLRDLIREQHESGVTVIFSTHVMQQAETICDHIVMIHQGNKVLDDTMDTIRASHDPRSVLFTPKDPSFDTESLKSVPGVGSLTSSERGHEAILTDDADPMGVLRSIVSGYEVVGAELRRPSLEDVFIDIVRGGSDQSAEEIRRSIGEEVTP